MSGVEVIGAISAIVGILDASVKVYDSAQKDLKLSDTFQAIRSRLPILRDTLLTCENHLRPISASLPADVCEALEAILTRCDDKAGKLRSIFEKVIPGESDGWQQRYVKIVKRFGKGNKVEELMISITEDVQLVVNHHAVKSAGPEQASNLEKIVKEMKSVQSSLPEEGDGKYVDSNVHRGTGDIHDYRYSQSKIYHGNIGTIHEAHTHINHQPKDMLTLVCQWLAPPDPYLNLRRSIKLRSADTGEWYLRGAQYQAWKTGETPFTWLYGSAGSGKTILSAGIIQDMQAYRDGDPTRSLAIFFFDFNDPDKQNPTNMVKSLLSQFLNTCTHIPDAVRVLYAACENGRREASEHQLLQALKDTLELLPATFVVLDALDECSSWDALFDIIVEMHSWGKSTLRVLLTSRKEVEIELALEDIVPQDKRTCLESHLVDKDIKTHVHERLVKDKSFMRWQRDSEIKEEIGRTLGRKANGMFRWAACQLDTLAGCVTRGKVRRALEELPKSLDETYARILSAIDKGEHAEEALRILVWLTYAERPLAATEVLQVTGIVMEDDHRFDEDEVLEDPDDILRICSSLVSVATGTGEYNGVSDDDVSDEESFYGETDAESDVTYVRLAHFSVKEYLISTRPCLRRYRLQDQEPHDLLAKCCLIYLLRFHEDEWRSPDCESVFPLARYAARYWTQHARTTGILSKLQQDLSVELFTRNMTAFLAWMRFFDVDRPWDQAPDIRRTIDELPIPLYVASFEGLAHAVNATLDAGADVNALGGDYGTALQAASSEGHEKVVQMLINAGADVDAQGGFYSSALQAASSEGHEKVVQMLIDAGADVNAQGGSFGTALQAASSRGHETVVQMLVDAGAANM